MKKETMTNNKPLMIDAEVTLKFQVEGFCYSSDIQGDTREEMEQNLKELMQQELEEMGIANFVFDDTDFYLMDVKIIS